MSNKLSFTHSHLEKMPTAKPFGATAASVPLRERGGGGGGVSDQTSDKNETDSLANTSK